MELLNRILASQGGTRMPEGPMPWPAPSNGFCHPLLHQRILIFQQTNRLIADGHVDPNGQAIAMLNRLALGGHAIPSDGNRNRDKTVAAAFQALELCNVVLRDAALQSLLPDKMTRLRESAAAAEGALRNTGLKVPALKNPAPPVQNSAVVVILGAALTLTEIVVIGIALIGLQLVVLIPIYKRLFDLLNAILTALYKSMVQAVEGIERAVKVIRANTLKCRPKIDDFLAVSESTIIAIRTGRPHEALNALLKRWLDAYLAMIQCLGGMEMFRPTKRLLEYLQILVGGKRLIDLLFELFFGQGHFPRLP
ncbi:MAG: hypothetical protein IT166_18400 [Bryobacterales bacterium]|nr:hypothetical protein [Bryobacterales bacterium]